jgi:hypothetical protein
VIALLLLYKDSAWRLLVVGLLGCWVVPPWICVVMSLLYRLVLILDPITSQKSCHNDGSHARPIAFELHEMQPIVERALQNMKLRAQS